MRNELKRRGIDLTDVIIRDAQNQFAVILVDETNGDRIVLWDRDERLMMRERDLPVEAIARARVAARRRRRPGGGDPRRRDRARARRATTSDIDRLTDRTPELIVGGQHSRSSPSTCPRTSPAPTIMEGALQALRQPHQQLLCRHARRARRDGARRDRFHYAPAFQVDAVDTTGAGDVFRAGFIYALLRGWPTDDILRFANAAAAVSCTRLGALGGIPTLEEVSELVASGKVRA